MEGPILTNAGPSRESALVTDLGTRGLKVGDHVEHFIRLLAAELNMYYPWQMARQAFGMLLLWHLRNPRARLGGCAPG